MCAKANDWDRLLAAGVAVVAVLGSASRLQAQAGGPTPKILNLDGTPAPVSTVAIEAVPPGPARVIYSVQSPHGGNTAASRGTVASAAGGGTEAIVYLNDTFSGFGAFDNYNASTGLLFPGTMISDNLGLGNGFAPGGTISSYNLDVFRSSLDPQPGLADIHVELWDGDPFCATDTPGQGFSCTPIAGTEADFVNLPAASFLNLNAVLPKGVTAPNTRVWMTISTSETANPAPCRLGWLISGLKPSIGNDLPDDLYENQFDDDGRANGGTCCIDGSACNATDPICAFCGSTGAGCLSDADCPAGDTCFGGAEDGDRGFCSDFGAESAFIFFFGGPCLGEPNIDFCATFLAEVRSQAEATITLQPVSNQPDGTLDPGASIVGNEILMEKGGSKVFLENRISDWDVVDNACVGGANDGLACTSGADCPDACINGLDNGNACTSDADCRNKCEGGTNDGLECASSADCPGGVCDTASCRDRGACGQQLKAWQLSLDSSGYTSGLRGTLTPILVPCTSDADCLGALGGNCSIGGESCAMDTDCAFFPIAACEGPECVTYLGPTDVCSPAWIATGRTDYVFAAPVSDLPAVDLATLDFRWASTVTGNPIDEPDPFPAGGLYAGTLVLNVSANAAGTFTVGYFPPPASALVNHGNALIPLLGLVPAKITVRTGQCCDPRFVPCICAGDTLTRNECEAIGGLFNPNTTCADPCGCCGDPDCDDGDACTDDTCDAMTGVCSSTPIDCDDGLICTVDSCDPGVGCINGPLDCDDGLGCTTDSCVEPGGCVNTPIDCDDGDVCTVDSCTEPNDFCENIPVNSFPCSTLADCPIEASCCTGEGFCACLGFSCCLPDGTCEIACGEADCRLIDGAPMLGTKCQGDFDPLNGIDDACEFDELWAGAPPGPHWVDVTEAGTDYIATEAAIGIDLDLDCVGDITVNLTGPVQVTRSAGTSGPLPHRMDTEITAMTLTGGGLTLRAGAGGGQGGVLPPSPGSIVEQLTDPALADSSFDVFFEVDLGGGLLAYNQESHRVEAVIDCVPPDAVYANPSPDTLCVPLLDSPISGTGTVVANLVFAEHDTSLGGCCWRRVGGVLECNGSVTQEGCPAGWNFVDNRSCGDPECGREGPIPTVSEWGLIVLALLLLTVGKVSFGRRRTEAT